MLHQSGFTKRRRLKNAVKFYSTISFVSNVLFRVLTHYTTGNVIFLGLINKHLFQKIFTVNELVTVRLTAKYVHRNIEILLSIAD